MKNEIWKDIDGFGGLYKISNYGRVYSARRNRIMRTSNVRGYPALRLHKENYHRTHTIHRLVGFAFLEKKDFQTDINHKDGNKENNHVSNLEWVTRSENLKHAFKNGLNPGYKKDGENNPTAKLTKKDVLFILESKKNGISSKDLAGKLNINEHHINSIARGRNWKKVYAEFNGL